jgi:hypothetical protein
MGRQVRLKGIKATPKSMEKDLLAKAAKLAEDPSPLIPQCTGKCWRCPYDKMLKKMQKVAQDKGNAEALQGHATYGDQLVRAYAATISLAASGKIPYLSMKKLPFGEVSFAVRGKVDPERLIGVQHYDDPDLRLLAYFEEARAKDLHIYSAPDRLFCSSDGPHAPDDYVKEMVETAPYQLDVNHTCGHPDAGLALILDWVSPKLKFSIGSECAADTNLLHHLVGRIAARDPTDDFEVDVRYQPKCVADCGDCRLKHRFDMSAGLKDGYKKGTVDDATLVASYLKERQADLKRSGGSLFIAGDNCYGRDKERFLAQVKGSEAERAALAALVRAKDVVIVAPNDQAGKMIADLWSDFKAELLAAVASPDAADRALSASANLTPPQIIEEARRLEMAKVIGSRLPDYVSLGEVGSLADTVARAYKIEGKAAMVRAIEKAKPREHRLKAVAYGFLSAVGEAEGRTWQFTKEEMDFGAHLSQFAKALLQAEGQQYDDALRTLISACGASENVVRK